MLSVEKSAVASAPVAPGLLVLALFFVLAPILVPGGGIVRFPRVIHLYPARAVAIWGTPMSDADQILVVPESSTEQLFAPPTI